MWLHQTGGGLESDSTAETDQDEDDVDLQSEVTKMNLRVSAAFTVFVLILHMVYGFTLHYIGIVERF